MYRLESVQTRRILHHNGINKMVITGVNLGQTLRSVACNPPAICVTAIQYVECSTATSPIFWRNIKCNIEEATVCRNVRG
jgi:hypothetical protein